MCYKNSIYNVNIIFDRVYFSNIWIRALRVKLEKIFREFINGVYIFRSIIIIIFSFTRILVVGDFNAPRRIEDLSVRKQIFDSEDILRIKIDRLAEKVTYFNNHYIYRAGIGTRVKLINEFNDINVNIAEYVNVINNRFNIFINLNTDSLLVLVDGRED